eukprot:TRINITY_DN5878_c0_g1_i7.p2 TRINITY_DN5878_c0_g1~~TRINITY_DN5878_c0_g1_i7.p2  ORF type:complete len:108 (+),score=28.96 TRINITY_DN5878_c0_g1_i7:388-711(+)
MEYISKHGDATNFFELFMAEKTNNPDMIYHVLAAKEKLNEIAEDYANKDINQLFKELEQLKKELKLPQRYQDNSKRAATFENLNTEFEQNYREKQILEKLKGYSEEI